MSEVRILSPQLIIHAEHGIILCSIKDAETMKCDDP